MRITRDELYKEIWNEPATKLAHRYDVSSSYLARVCEALNVPHPPRGYWARRAVGEQVPIPPLPPAGPGDPLSWEKGVAVLERLPPLAVPQPTSKGAAKPRQRPAHHPLVTAWRGVLEEAKLTEGAYLMPRKKNVLDAFVTKPMIRGAADALDSILIELEMRGHRVQLSSDVYQHRPPVDVAQSPIRNDAYYNRRANEWAPGRPTIAYLQDVQIGLTLFELTEHVRVRRTGADRYVRISDLSPMRRYAPQAPGEEDDKRDMPTGRLVLRAYSPRRNTEWRQEWTESQKGEFLTMVKPIADALEEAVPILVKQVQDAEQRERQQRAQAAIEHRRYLARERAEVRQRARQAAKEELRAIVKAWNEAFALEAFFAELSRRASALDGDERARLEVRIQTARELVGGQDAVDRFLNWKLPPAKPTDRDESVDEGGQDSIDDDA
jgi:hypothetical protein